MKGASILVWATSCGRGALFSKHRSVSRVAKMHTCKSEAQALLERAKRTLQVRDRNARTLFFSRASAFGLRSSRSNLLDIKVVNAVA